MQRLGETIFARLPLPPPPVFSLRAVGNENEVVTELRLDGAVNDPNRVVEDTVIELFDHLTRTELTEGTALGG